MMTYPLIRTRQDLVAMLQFDYALMIATEPLLIAAGMEEDLDEERGHAELLLEDLRGMGEEPSEEDYAAACIAGSQYYYIRHVSPLMLLGYRLALECKPMPIEAIEGLEAFFEANLSCLRVHAEADPRHSQEIAARIQGIDSPELRRRITYNAACTYQAIGHIFHLRLEGKKGEDHASSLNATS